jgi:hypothetical protein
MRTGVWKGNRLAKDLLEDLLEDWKDGRIRLK